MPEARQSEVGHGRYQPVVCWVCNRGNWEPVRKSEVGYWDWLRLLISINPAGHA